VATKRDALLRRAAEAKRASRRVAFRDADNPKELAIDIAALANSGGGVVVLHADVRVDRDELVRRIGFDRFTFDEVARNGASAVAIVVEPVGDAPILVDGHAYFRHGGKSRPATAEDLRKFLERRLDLVRRHWLKSIREVLIAPEGAHVAVVETTERDEHGEPVLIRLSADPNAPVYGRLDPDRTHPYRQKEVVSEVNRKLPEGVEVKGYDILSVRRVHEISEERQPEFTHVPKFGSPQYSDAFVDWIVEQHASDPEFFTKAKEKYTRSVRRSRSHG
jgi:hypothetical protein